MLRRVIQIDEEKCNGCGLCVNACHEGAIALVDGKAKLIRDDYCDGLGDCLPSCPVNAISFIEREALPYDEKAVQEHMKQRAKESGCVGVAPQVLQPSAVSSVQMAPQSSALQNWPVQIKLAPIQAPYFQNANLLIAADCTAYAYASFHEHFMRNKVTLIGCPKLDAIQYAEKLTQIIAQNEIRSVTIVRMEVPCCGGLQTAVETALKQSGKWIPWNVVTITRNGECIE